MQFQLHIALDHFERELGTAGVQVKAFVRAVVVIALDISSTSIAAPIRASRLFEEREDAIWKESMGE